MTRMNKWMRPAAAAVWIATRDAERTLAIDSCAAAALAAMVVIDLEPDGGFERWRKEMHCGLLAGWRCQGRPGSFSAGLREIEPGEWRSNTPRTDFAVRGHDGPTSYLDLGVLWADVNRAYPTDAAPTKAVKEADVRRWILSHCGGAVHPALKALYELAPPNYSGNQIKIIARKLGAEGLYQYRGRGDHDRKMKTKSERT
jgi:hypothetical protein